MAASRPTIDEMWVLIQEQRALLTRQQEEIEALKAERSERADGAQARAARGSSRKRRVSRAGLLKAAAAGMAGLAGAELAGSLSAEEAAADGNTSDFFVASGATVPASKIGVDAQASDGSSNPLFERGVVGNGTLTGVHGMNFAPNGTGRGGFF